MADALKAEGNKLFAEKKFTESIEKFSQAIELDPTNHVLYSNRSGAYASLKDWSKALDDATKTTEIKPDWAKGWGRKGTALHGEGDLGRFQPHAPYLTMLTNRSRSFRCLRGGS